MSKKFFVYDPDTGDETDAEEFTTFEAQYAAEDYAEWYDDQAGEGYQDRRVVLVREDGKTEWAKFTVTAQPDVHYSAYEE